MVDGSAVRRQVQVSGTSPNGVIISSGLIGGEDLIVNCAAGTQGRTKSAVEEGRQ